jgi:hypothetical protein
MVTKSYTPKSRGNFQEFYWKNRGNLLVVSSGEEGPGGTPRIVYNVLGIEESREEVKNGSPTIHYSQLPKKLEKKCRRFLTAELTGPLRRRMRINVQRPKRSHWVRGYFANHNLY